MATDMTSQGPEYDDGMLFPRVPSSAPNTNVDNQEDDFTVRVMHEAQQYGSARDFLLNVANSDAELVDAVFDKEGKWRYPADKSDPYRMEPGHLAEHLLSYTEPIYKLCQDSLAAINWFGYNDHGPIHVRRVAETALELSNQLELDAPTKRIIVTAAALHDLGNLVSRDDHSMESPDIALAIFPKLRDKPSDWRAIRRAIELHNNAVYRKFVNAEQCEDANERIKHMKGLFGVEGLTVFIADKVQFLRERINDKALSKEAIATHKYSLVNLLFETTSVGFVDDKSTFKWNIKFRPDLTFEEMARFAELAEPSNIHPSGFKTFVPPEIHNPYEENGIRYFQSAIDLLWDKKKSLLRDTVEATLAYSVGEDLDKPKKVVVEISDDGTSDLPPASVTLNITRTNVNSAFDSKPSINISDQQ